MNINHKNLEYKLDMEIKLLEDNKNNLEISIEREKETAKINLINEIKKQGYNEAVKILVERNEPEIAIPKKEYEELIK